MLHHHIRAYGKVQNVANLFKGGTLRAGRQSWGTIVQENKRNYQERSHLFEKRTERIKHVLKNIGTISKRAERNGNCLNRKCKIRNVFLLSRTRSRLKTEQGGRTVL